MTIRIYIPDEDCFGEIISEGFLISQVRYSVGGIEYNVVMLNEDFEIIEGIEEEN